MLTEAMLSLNTMTEDGSIEEVSSGVSVEINISYLNSAYPEVKALRVGKAVGVAGVELWKKKTCKIIS
ncbi:hypothetical protein L3X38_041333 [Prunus dulcis]|uniref:Thioesterase superfamily protein n=1 Tax=Prunus dulcis TaxID=3755 RepID=A0AAD4YK90_PRUDU|nr:hypothetical protein L3X38_041333 [Prunus dulcis]